MTAPAQTQTDLAPSLVDTLRQRGTVPVWSKTEVSAASVLGISRWAAYGLASSDALPVVRCGRSVRVSRPRAARHARRRDRTRSRTLTAAEQAALDRLRGRAPNTSPSPGDLDLIVSAVDRLTGAGR